MKISTIVTLIVLVMAELFVYTWCHVETIHTGYTITSQRDHEAELRASNEKLQLELSHLRRPERIMRISSMQLGLVMPEPGQVVFIK
ncbi:MAG: cell division protein FtsL [Pseudomonadota bacterium]